MCMYTLYSMVQEVWNITVLGLGSVLKSHFKPVSGASLYLVLLYDFCLQERAELLRETAKVSSIPCD